MRGVFDAAPAAGMTFLVLAAIAFSRLVPMGEALVLVRVPGVNAAEVLAITNEAEATLVSRPAPGFAVVFGDAARIRARLGAAVLWKGVSACS